MPTPVIEEIYPHLQPFNPNAVALTPETDIAQDLSIDSMAMMEMVFTLEEKFDISIPLHLLGDVRTVGDLAALVEKIKRPVR